MRKQPAITLRCILLAGGVMLCACSSAQSAVSHPSTGLDAERSPEHAGADVPAPASAAAAVDDDKESCSNVRRAKRTFIGLSDDQSLDDFEATALEAERLLGALEHMLCRIGLDQDADGSLRAALDHGSVEISGVRFTRGDLTLADVDVRSVLAQDASSGEPQAAWILHMQRNAADWLVLAAAKR